MHKNVVLALLVGFLSTGLAQSESGGASTVPENLQLKLEKGVGGRTIAPWGDGVPAEFEDFMSNDETEKPLTCAMFRMNKGEPLVYDYEYDDIKYVLEGSFTVSDGNSEVTAVAGDVLFFPAGSTITFTSDEYGLGWACGNR